MDERAVQKHWRAWLTVWCATFGVVATIVTLALCTLLVAIVVLAFFPDTVPWR